MDLEELKASKAGRFMMCFGTLPLGSLGYWGPTILYRRWKIAFLPQNKEFIVSIQDLQEQNQHTESHRK